MFYTNNSSNNSPWITLAGVIGVFFATAIYVSSNTQSMELTTEEQTPILNVCLADRPAQTTAPLGNLIATINKRMQHRLTVHIVSASIGGCQVTIVLSARFPFRGASGIAVDGRNVILMNPRLADESTLLDELAHHLRGHVFLPHLSTLTDLLMNVYLDLSNSVWWWGVRADVWQVDAK